MAVSRTEGGKKRGFLLLAFVVGAMGLAWWLAASPQFTVQKLYHHLASPLLRLLASLAVGLLVGQAIESLGWATKLGFWVAPALRWGRLGQESAASFTAACVSGILANTMLVTFLQEGRLSRRELILTYLVNSGLPVYLLHLPTTFFIILPLTREAGLIYLGLGLAAAGLRTGAFLGWARWRLPAVVGEPSGEATPAPHKRGMWRDIWQKFQRRFSRVVLYTLPVYVLIFLANDQGVFRWLRDLAASWAAVSFFPVEAASVVIFSVAAEFTSGMAAAGALLQSGALTVKQTVLALILGNIVATPIRALRHQLPSHAGIFSPKLGTELLLLSQGFRLASLALVAIPYGLWG